MSILTIALVLAGLLMAVALGVARGLDLGAAGILAMIVVVGALGIAMARRYAAARIEPLVCPGCSGMNARTAPYCKHCGEPL